jgi:hypothetical protein
MNNKEKAREALHVVLNYLKGDEKDPEKSRQLISDAVDKLVMCVREETNDQVSSAQQLAKKDGVAANALAKILNAADRLRMQLPQVEPEIDDLAGNVASAIDTNTQPQDAQPQDAQPQDVQPQDVQPDTSENNSGVTPPIDGVEATAEGGDDEWPEDMSPAWDGNIEKSLNMGKSDAEQQQQ